MISLVIPVYNYEEKLPETLEHLRAWLKGRSDVQEILFVNDGSTDGTARLLENLEKPMRVMTLASNQGKGAAVRAGALAAKGDHIFFTDIDMPYDLKAIDLAQEKFKTGADMVSGSRNVQGSGSTVSRKLERRISSVIFSRLANLILIHPTADTQCGLKGFTREAAKTVFSEISSSGYVFDVEIWYIAQRKELTTALVPVMLINDSNSSVNVARDGVGMAFGLMRLYARTRTHITRRDAFFIGALGAAMALLLLPTLQNVGILTLIAAHGIPVFFTVILLVLLLPFCMLAGSLGLSLLPLHKHSAAEFSRYAVVGAYNTALNAAIFNSLIFLSGISQGPWVTGFALITFAIVITQAFFWNIFWTFHHSSPQDRKKQYARFFGVTATTALINLGIIHIIVNVIGPPAGVSAAIWANCALLFTIVTAVIGNFFGYKFFVFTK